ncbi:MAG: type IV toxin-antitoxin system AbiEi family antitoxin domain-containing protein [Ruminococcus sp.]|nr:type IV toxin-antitoxin system AbiEi family antitoxin domain-containing protein [Ruminococcus sp.]
MSLIKNIERLIDEMPYDTAFVISDFLDCCDYETVKKSLSRLEKKGIIRRVIRGVYDKPSYSSILQEYSVPSMQAIAQAIARQFNWNICPCGDTVLNELGLSTQVPSRQTYISSGPYRKYEIGNQALEFKHSALKDTVGKSKSTAVVIQALKTIGKTAVDDKTICTIGRRLSSDEKKSLLYEAKTAPIWMYPYLKKISEVKEDV